MNGKREGLLISSHVQFKQPSIGATPPCGCRGAHGGLDHISGLADRQLARIESLSFFEPSRAASVPTQQ